MLIFLNRCFRLIYFVYQNKQKLAILTLHSLKALIIVVILSNE